jgi:transcriptional regulator with XRE-family HTH domain
LKNNRIDEDVGKEQKEKINGQIRTGYYLKTLRLEHDLSLTKLGNKLGVSAAYLSNVETGAKPMSDHFIRQIADFYMLDENVLFELLGRVPLLAREQLDEDSNLQQLLSEIKRNKKLTEEKKQQLFQQMYNLYKNFPE